MVTVDESGQSDSVGFVVSLAFTEEGLASAALTGPSTRLPGLLEVPELERIAAGAGQASRPWERPTVQMGDKYGVRRAGQVG